MLAIARSSTSYPNGSPFFSEAFFVFKCVFDFVVVEIMQVAAFGILERLPILQTTACAVFERPEILQIAAFGVLEKLPSLQMSKFLGS